MSSGVAGLIEQLRKQNEELQRAMLEQQEGGLLYIAAMVHANGGGVQLSKEEMEAAVGLQLERADAEDGGLILRTSRPEAPPELAAANDAENKPAIITELKPTLAQVDRPIILPGE